MKAAAKKSTKAAAATKAAATKTAATKNEAAPRRPGVKVRLHEFFTAGGSATLEQLVKQMGEGATESNVRTALSDIKSEKYAPGNKPINVVRDEDGKYSKKRR